MSFGKLQAVYMLVTSPPRSCRVLEQVLLIIPMQRTLVVTTNKEEKIKKRLQESIFRKRKFLEVWTEKVESLKLDLDLVKNEYTVRIGYLFLKDNQLDLEIIQYKNLKRLMDEGMTYDEAVRAEEDTFYNEILRMQKEQEKIEGEKILFEKRNDVSEEIQEGIKILWKKLIRKFHPDLVTDPEEKLQREDLMKKINQAYAEADTETLQSLEDHSQADNIEESTIERLEKILVDTENLIQNAKETFKELRVSEWYGWKKRLEKAKKERVDIFAEMERNLLDDIVKKIEVLQQLRMQVNPQAVL